MEAKYTKTRYYIYAAIIVIIVSLSVASSVLYKKNVALNKKLAESNNNVNAYELFNSELKDSVLVLNYTINALNNSVDSINQKMNAVRKELRVKDKELESISRLVMTSSKKDTVMLRDTVFIKGMKIDTTLTDNSWYNLALSLEYPNKITVRPEFNSDTYIVISSSKRIVGKPKVCWIGRLFQKRHVVVEGRIVEKNPYINVNEQRFIKIVD